MAKWSNDAVMDAALDVVASATTLLLTSSQPADRTDALAAALADVTVSSGDFAKSDGVSGRKVTVASKADFPVDTTGTATHVCLIDGTRLIYVTTCTSMAVTSGNTVTTSAWNVQIADPV